MSGLLWTVCVLSAAACAVMAATPPIDGHSATCVFVAVWFSHAAIVIAIADFRR